MPLRPFKPTSPGRRGATGHTFEEVTKKRPERALVAANKRKAGRNNMGRITTRHRGGGSPKLLRIIDFKRDKTGVPGRVAAIEYDPNRSARLALIFYADGEKRYILAPNGLKVNDRIMAGAEAEARVGNSLPLRMDASTELVISKRAVTVGEFNKFVKAGGEHSLLIVYDKKTNTVVSLTVTPSTTRS